MARLAISLLGPYKVALDGQPVAWFQSDKVRALLAYLAVEAASPHSRHALAGLLWPDVPEDHAHHSLSQALCNLRSVLHDQATSPPCLTITPHTIQFNCASDCWLDVAEFGSLVHWESGRLVRRLRGNSDDPQQPTNLPAAAAYQATILPALHQAVALYRGPFLDDLALGDAVAFEEWATVERERLHRLLMAALHQVVEMHETRGEFEEALEYAWRQVDLDPWREEAHVQVMHLLAHTGRRSEALVQYGICRRLLARELGVEPAVETARLYEQIRSATGPGMG